MSQNCTYLYAVSFTVGAESGLALIAAPTERDAIQVLKSSGSRSACSKGYTIIQTRDIGMTAACNFGILMESFVNAMEAYDALVKLANKFIKGDKGDSIWSSAYIDENMYLHLVESEPGVNQHLVFDQETGYLRIV